MRVCGAEISPESYSRNSKIAILMCKRTWLTGRCDVGHNCTQRRPFWVVFRARLRRVPIPNEGGGRTQAVGGLAASASDEATSNNYPLPANTRTDLGGYEMIVATVGVVPFRAFRQASIWRSPQRLMVRKTMRSGISSHRAIAADSSPTEVTISVWRNISFAFAMRKFFEGSSTTAGSVLDFSRSQTSVDRKLFCA